MTREMAIQCSLRPVASPASDIDATTDIELASLKKAVTDSANSKLEMETTICDMNVN